MKRIGLSKVGGAVSRFEPFKASNLKGETVDGVYTVTSYYTPMLIFVGREWYANEDCINYSLTSKKHYHNAVQPNTKEVSGEYFMEKLNG